MLLLAAICVTSIHQAFFEFLNLSVFVVDLKFENSFIFLKH